MTEFVFVIFTHFSGFLVSEMTCLVTLFDRKLHVFKIDHFWHFWWTFVHPKCKLSSLRSQCWMRLFLWFSNTVKLTNTAKPESFIVAYVLSRIIRDVLTTLDSLSHKKVRKLQIDGSSLILKKGKAFQH